MNDTPDDFSRPDPRSRPMAEGFSREALAGEKLSDYDVKPPRSQGFKTLVALLVLIAFVAIVGYSYDKGKQDGSEELAPLVAAPGQLVKERPDDPGGEQIPFQESALFDVMNKSPRTAPQEEVLLAPVKSPVPPPVPEDRAVEDLAVVASPVPDSTPVSPRPANPDEQRIAEMTEIISRFRDVMVDEETDEAAEIAPAEEETQPVIVKPEPVKAAKAEIPEAVDSSEHATSTTPVLAGKIPLPKPIRRTVTPVAVPATAAGAFRVQMVSLRGKADAEKSRSDFGKRYRALLNGVSLHVISADIPGKGTYHRVQSAPLSRAAADGLCKRIKGAGGSCFVTK